MWELITRCIRRSAKEVLGISRGGRGKLKGAWWWNKEVKQKVKEKQNASALTDSGTDGKKVVNLVKYKTSKRQQRKLSLQQRTMYMKDYIRNWRQMNVKGCLQVSKDQGKENKGLRKHKVYQR